MTRLIPEETSGERRPFTVVEITKEIKSALEGSFKGVSVEGEISNFKRHSSGHLYFTIKDRHAQLRCVMFRYQARSLKFQPDSGMKVVASGDITVYEAGGVYQLRATRMRPAGLGDLHLEFERLKAKLQQEGLFDAQRKKPLPFMPRRIGIVTSPTGAAIRDMIRVLSHRDPLVDIILRPVRVQGGLAADEIAAAIDAHALDGGMDLLIVGRGGGSIEDLWAFNEEVVARAIARCPIPIISAVGHETDFTIADFVADVRAATPSNAAELATPELAEIRQRAARARNELTFRIRRQLENARLRLQRLARSDAFRPQRRVQEYLQRLDAIQDGLAVTFERKVERNHAALDRIRQTIVRLPGSILKDRQHELKLVSMKLRRFNLDQMRRAYDVISARIEAVDPMKPLERGYSLTYLKDGTLVRSYRDVRVRQKVVVKLGEGQLDCAVERRNFL